MNVKRITRLIKLLQILHSGGVRGPAALARECNVSRRTAYRDLQTLRAAGLDITFDKGLDRYLLPNAYYLPPVNLTAVEAMSLLTLAMELGRSDRLPFFEAAQSAAVRLEGSLPQPLRDQLKRITQAIHIEPTPVNRLEDKRAVYQQLVDAVAASYAVRIEYGRIESQRVITKLRPYRLLFRRHNWYVIGRSSTHCDVRAFSLSRINALERLEERFKVPKRFSIERYLRNAWHLSPVRGADHLVVVRFSPLVAQNVAEVKWHKTQLIQFNDDGSLIFSAHVSGLNEIVWWILSYGDQAEVIQPERLRRFVAQRARNMVSRYAGIDVAKSPPH